MPANDAACGREALAFIEDIDRLPTTMAVLETMQGVLARFGFEYFCFNTFPRPDQTFDEVLLACRLPAAWLKLYIDENYVHDNPSIRLCRRTVHPFEWADAPYDPEREPRAAEFVQRVRDFRLSEGFVVPVPESCGCVGDVWMGGHGLDLTTSIKSMLHLVGLYAFNHVRRLRGCSPVARASLTDREREVLTWVANGKSAWEIGEILHIAKRTVDEHAKSAARKLGASNRTHAVAIALSERAITL